MFCTTVIPTIGRDTLTRAVRSVLDQEFAADDFEVVVVNDSGKPLPDMPWRHSERVTVLNTQRRERSVARNAGAAVARGRYLHFLDDDDWMLPGALSAFWGLAQSTDATWLYGSYQTVDNNGDLVSAFDPGIGGNIFALLVAGESIPFQASLLRSDRVFAAGGFDPKIIGVEDRDLGRRLALIGRIAGTPEVVASIRVGQQSSTTDWSKLAERDRRGREKALSEPESFARLWASAGSSYLRGRVARAYLASTVWNLRHKHTLVAAGRALSGLTFAAASALLPGFWRGARTKIH